MMSFIFACFILWLTYIIGHNIAKIIGVFNRIESFGLALLFGPMIVTYVLFLFHYYLNSQFTFVLVLIVLALLLATTFLIRYFISIKDKSTFIFIPKVKTVNYYIDSIKQLFYSLSFIEKLLISLLVVLIIFSVISNYVWPITDWDSLALYDYRARLLADTGNFLDGIRRNYFLQYPPFTSLLHTIFYLFKISQAKLWYSVLYCGLVAVFYAVLRRDLSRVYSVFGAFLVASSPLIFEHSRMAYTNMPYSIYLALGYIYLCQWLRKSSTTDLIVGGLLIASSTWIRLTEPFWIPSLIILFMGFWLNKKDRFLIIIIGLVILYLKLPWNQFLADHSPVNNTNPLSLAYGVTIQDSLNGYLNRIVEVAVFLDKSVSHLFVPYSLAFTISIVSIIFYRTYRKLLDVLVVLSLVAMIALGTFVFSYQYPGWYEIPDSAARMSMFVIPLLIYIIFISDIWSRNYSIHINKKMISGKYTKHKLQKHDKKL